MDKKQLIVIVASLGLLVLVGLAVALRQSVKNTDVIIQATNDKGIGQQATLVKASVVDEILQNPQTFVVDVHTPEQTHIPGTDAFIPYDKISQSVEQLPANKDTPILVYCRSGSMSAWASKDLIKLGFTNVYDLEGGVNSYKESHAEVALTPKQIELGTVVYGDLAKTEFTLTNYTSESLRITNVTTSCGCTSAQVDIATLGPYEATTVQVSFDPAVHKDDTDLGDLTRTIFIDTDNPNFSRVEADITATVVKQ